MSDAKTNDHVTKPSEGAKDDADMIANLDLLMNFDIVENEKDWSLFSNGSSGKDSMPEDLPNLDGEDQ